MHVKIAYFPPNFRVFQSAGNKKYSLESTTWGPTAPHKKKSCRLLLLETTEFGECERTGSWFEEGAKEIPLGKHGGKKIML